ncbi:MAG: alpha-amylase family glycosyl hydrolase [Lachnospiraceae bacterium]
MNPCFASPFGDAGYDVSDYYTAAPRYGTNEDLKRLFDEVHKRGMHILLDLVSHTSVDHPWFKESLKAEKIHIQTVTSGRTISGISQRALAPSRVFPIVMAAA